MLINKCIGFRVVDKCYAHAFLIYTCKRVRMQFPLVLLIIRVEDGEVEVLDSLLKPVEQYEIVKGIVNK